VVVNELGEIGLDNVMIAQATDNVVLLDAGCLCCGNTARSTRPRRPDGRRARVRSTLRARHQSRRAALRPSPLLNVLLGIAGHRGYAFEATVCTVDASTFLASRAEYPELDKQAPSPSASTSASAMSPTRRRFCASWKSSTPKLSYWKPGRPVLHWGKDRKYKVSLNTKGRIGRREHFSAFARTPFGLLHR